MSLFYDLQLKISNIVQLTEREKQNFINAGFENLGDILSIIPLDYEHRDDTQLCSIKEAVQHKKTLIRAKVISHTYVQLTRKGRLLIVHIQDDSGKAELHCYGREFLKKVLVQGHETYFWGSFSLKYGKIICSSFEVIRDPSNIRSHLAHKKSNRLGLIPRYSLPQGFSQISLQNALRKIITQVTIPELHPYLKIQEHETLLGRQEALLVLHAPQSMKELELAQKRFAFDEILLFQLFLKQNSTVSRVERSPRHISSRLTRELQKHIPFKLTKGQVSVINEIQTKLALPQPMTCLLQGDVGSGKTIVALFCALAVIESHEQVSFAVPSETLAFQHSSKISTLLSPLGVRVALLTGSTKKKERLETLDLLSRGEIDILVGTHALYSSDVVFSNLGMIIIDEQHRFGVNQRLALLNKGIGEHRHPDLLLMSATPIPRSLALTVYGDMEILSLKERPAMQQSISTHLVKMGRRKEVYERVKQKVRSNEQAFFVFPQIEQSDEVARNKKVKSVEEMYPEIKDYFLPCTTAMIHSKLLDEEKTKLMEEFAAGNIQVLLSTTIIEVGIDIPNASTMCIFNAERFGLATLHQLRGRVGRGSLAGEAFILYAEPLSEVSKERLKILYNNDDGFTIAEEDLRLRGPGDINQLGVRQSGAILFQFVDVFGSMSTHILQKTLEVSNLIISKDSELKDSSHRALRRILDYTAERI